MQEIWIVDDAILSQVKYAGNTTLSIAMANGGLSHIAANRLT